MPRTPKTPAGDLKEAMSPRMGHLDSSESGGDQWREQCRKIVVQIKAMKYQGHQVAELFLELPNYVEYPDYYEVISNPISIHEIQEKLNSNVYKSAQDFKNDIDLMAQNAMTYNDPESLVYEDAKRIAKHVATRLSTVEKPKKQEKKSYDIKQIKQIYADMEDGNVEQLSEALEGGLVYNHLYETEQMGQLVKMTPLQCAALHGNKDAVEMLMQAGADAEIVDADFGSTALLWAAYGGHYDVCKLLVQHYNVNVDAVNVHGQGILELVPSVTSAWRKLTRDRRDSIAGSVSSPTSKPKHKRISLISPSPTTEKISLKMRITVPKASPKVSAETAEESDFDEDRRKSTRVRIPTKKMAELLAGDDSRDSPASDSISKDPTALPTPIGFRPDGTPIFKRKRGRPSKTDKALYDSLIEQHKKDDVIDVVEENEAEPPVPEDELMQIDKPPESAPVSVPVTPMAAVPSGVPGQRTKLVLSVGLVSNMNLIRHILSADIHAHAMMADATVRTLNFRVVLAPQAAATCQVAMYHNKKKLNRLAVGGTQPGDKTPSMQDYNAVLQFGMNSFELYVMGHVSTESGRTDYDVESYAIHINRLE